MSGDWPGIAVTAFGEGVLASDFGNSTEWRKSSRCEGGACVEAAARDDVVLLRRSVDLDGPTLAFTHAAWQHLICRIKQAFPKNAD